MNPINRTKILAALVLASLTSHLQAQSIWTNTAGGEWNTAANWNPNTVPGVAAAANITSINSGSYTVNYDLPMAAASVGAVTVATNGGTTFRTTLNLNSNAFTCTTLSSGVGGSINIGPSCVVTSTVTGYTIAAGGNSTVTNNGGILSASVGSLANSVTVGAAGKLVINGGTNLFPILNTPNGDGMLILITNGLTTINTLQLYRGGDAGVTGANGFTVNGPAAQVNIGTGGINLGYGNSWATMTLFNGTVSNAGPFRISTGNSSSRGGRYYQTNGILTCTSSNGLVLVTANSQNAVFSMAGGVATVEKVTLVTNATLTAATATMNITNKGVLYVGSGGIVQAATGSGSSYGFNFGNGGTLGAKTNWSSSINLNLVPGTAILNAADAAGVGHDISLSGTLTNSGALMVTGAGTVTLTGANTYTNATTVNGGQLTVSTASLGAGAYSVTNNGVLTARVGNPGSSLLLSNLTLSSATLAFDVNAANPTAPIIANLGSLNVTGTIPVNVKGTLSEGPAFTLLNYAGTRNGDGTFVLGVLPPGVQATLNDDTVNHVLTLTVTAADTYLSWLGGGSGTWDVNNAANLVWKGHPSLAAAFYKENILGAPVLQLDDTATAASPATLALNTIVTPASLTVSNSAKNYVISGTGSITGSQGLTKQGAGTLTLSTANSFTGPVNLNGGVVSFSTANNLGAGTAINFGGGMLQYASGNTEDVSVRALTFNAGGAIFDTGGNDVTFAKPVGNNGTGGLTKTGLGTLTLNGTNKFSGNTVVSQGTLTLGSSTYISYSPAIIVQSGAVLDAASWGSGLLLSTPVSQILAGLGQVSGEVTAGPSTTITPATNNAAGTLVFNGGLTMAGGTMSYDVSTSSRDLVQINGNLTLTSGTLQVKAVGALTNGVYPVITYTGSLISGPGSAAALTITGFSQVGKIAQLSDAVVAGEIDLVVSSAGSAELVWAGDGLNNYWDVNASVNWLNGGSPSVFASGDKVLFDDSGSTTPAVNLTNNVSPGSITVSNSIEYVVRSENGSRITGGTGLTKKSTGKLTVLTANNNTGPTVISGGIVQVGDGGTTGDLGSGDITNNSVLVFQQPDSRTVPGAVRGTGSLVQQGWGTLLLAGPTTYTGPTTIGNTATFQVGTGGASGPLSTTSITNDGTLFLNSSSDWSYNNGIFASDAPGASELHKLGSGTLTLGGNNTYLGKTYVVEGTLKLASTNALPPTGLVLDGGASAAGTLDLSGFDTVVDGLSGITGPVLGQVVNNSGSGTRFLSVGYASATATFYGLIKDNSGSGGRVGLAKLGTGNLTVMSSNMVFSGGTTIGGGTVFLKGGIDNIIGTGPVTITNYGGLSLNGYAGGTGTWGNLTNDLIVPVGETGSIFCPTRANLTGRLTGGGTLNVTVDYVRTGLNGDWSAFSGQINVFARGTANEFRVGNTNGYANAAFYLNDNVVLDVAVANGLTVDLGELAGTANSVVGAGNASSTTPTWRVGARNSSVSYDGAIIGTSSINKVGTGTWALNGISTYSGTTTVSQGTLALGSAASISNSVTITVNSDATFDVSAVSPAYFVGAYTVGTNVVGTNSIGFTNVAQTLGGSGFVNGNVTVAGTAHLAPGAVGAMGTLVLSNNLAFADGSFMAFDLGTTAALGYGNDLVEVLGDLTLAGTNYVQLSFPNGPPAVGVPYTLFAYAGTLTGGKANLSAVSHLPLTFDDSTPNKITVTFHGGVGTNLVWVGTPTNAWLADTIANWSDGSSAAVFNTFDRVSFDNTAGNFTVNLAGTLQPTSVQVNSASNYTFSGSGKLAGATGLTKNGNGTLVLSNTGTNDYTGTTTISGGILQVGGNGTAGNLGPASVLNNATLAFNRSDALTNGGFISGSGNFLKLAANVLTFTGTNACSGSTTISNGALAVTHPTALAANAKIDLAATGAALDVSALPAGAIALGSAQTLQGIGAVRGSVSAPAGSTVSPGESGLGTLTITNTATLAGNTLMDLNSTNAAKSDRLTATNIVYGGTLTLNNLGPVLVATNTFLLFSAPVGHYSGAFSAIVPATPGPNLLWNTTNLAVNGILAITLSLPTTPTNITVSVNGGQLTLSWPENYIGWLLQANSVDVANKNAWFTYPGSVATNRVDVAIDPHQTNVFFRMVFP